jgi:hypothetical protein
MSLVPSAQDPRLNFFFHHYLHQPFQASFLSTSSDSLSLGLQLVTLSTSLNPCGQGTQLAHVGQMHQGRLWLSLKGFGIHILWCI